MPLVANSHEVVEGHLREGELWPILFQHCARTRSCDPMSNFGEAAGQASGFEQDATWYAETAAAVPEDGAIYGPRVIVTFSSLSEWGGPGGRPLTRQETPANLRAPIARQTWLSIEHRMPAEDLVPYYATLRTAQVRIPLAPGAADETREMLRARTEAEISGWVWSDGRRGARIELSTSDGERLWGGYSLGFDARANLEEDAWKALGAEPWFFDLSINRYGEPVVLNAVLEAVRRGSQLRLYVASPKGAMLTDDFETAGLADALGAALQALADPAIEQPLPVRCLPLLDLPPAQWTIDVASPAMRTCDARTRDQRRAVPGYAVRP
jgi:hypothetical protein